MKAKNKIFSKGLLVASTIAVSAMVSISAQAALVGGLTVVRVGCTTASTCTLVVDSAIGPAACTSTNITWDGSTSGGKNAYAALLTAKASGSTVRINFDDSVCNGSNPSMRTALLE